MHKSGVSVLKALIISSFLAFLLFHYDVGFVCLFLTGPVWLTLSHVAAFQTIIFPSVEEKKHTRGWDGSGWGGKESGAGWAPSDWRRGAGRAAPAPPPRLPLPAAPGLKVKINSRLRSPRLPSAFLPRTCPFSFVFRPAGRLRSGSAGPPGVVVPGEAGPGSRRRAVPAARGPTPPWNFPVSVRGSHMRVANAGPAAALPLAAAPSGVCAPAPLGPAGCCCPSAALGLPCGARRRAGSPRGAHHWTWRRWLSPAAASRAAPPAERTLPRPRPWTATWDLRACTGRRLPRMDRVSSGLWRSR